MAKLKTYYASAERKGDKEVLSENKIVQDYGYLRDIFNAMPEVAMVLNNERQIVYANEGLLSILPYKGHDEIIGLRPGEAIDCIHSTETEGGCGTTESCRYCGAVNAILESKKLDEKVEMECRIVSFIEDQEVSFDYKVTAAPVKIQGKTFTMVFMTDISSEKRRMALERIFFHDILNTAGGIQGFTGFLKQVDEPSAMKEYVKVVDQLSHDLIDEIQSQRALVLAENKDLKLDIKEVDALSIIEDTKNTVSFHVVAEYRTILLSHSGSSIKFKTDEILLKRILINLLKNALEASEDGGEVEAGFYSDNENITYYVHNDQFMKKEVQLQVFRRSFSTKGHDRGLGTYSIKLLTEKYLKGKVWFETDEQKGTTFYVKLPA